MGSTRSTERGRSGSGYKPPRYLTDGVTNGAAGSVRWKRVLAQCDEGPFSAPYPLADDKEVSPRDELRFVREQLESLSMARLTRPLDQKMVEEYQALCRRERRLLEAAKISS
jgi:hypothetical protein